MADINPAKHALFTTEMWMTAAMHIPTALTLSGLVGADNKWVLFASLLLSAVTQGSYNVSRGLLKSAMVTANPTPVPDATIVPVVVASPTAAAPAQKKSATTVAEQLLEQGRQTQNALQMLAKVLTERLPAKEPTDEPQPK